MREVMGSTRRWWGSELLDRGRGDAVWARAGHDVTYDRLRAQVASLQELFRTYGIRPGSTVALQGTQSFTQLWSVFALWALGAQVMLMGPDVRGGELERVLDQCRPQYHLSFRGNAPGRRIFHDECEVCVRRLKHGQAAVTGHCLIHFTSGSTGFAKAVGRTPESLLRELDTFRRIDGMPSAGARVMLLGPVSHAFTLVGGVLHHMAVGAVSVFAPRASRSALLRCLRFSGADTVLGAPRHFSALALGERAVRLPRLSRAISGGDRLDAAVHTRFAERFGVRIGQAYGTTETGIIAADPIGWFAPGSVGPAAPGVQIRIAQDGELHVRMAANPYTGQGVPHGRFLPDEAQDGPGWLRTRDRAELDPSSGALRILGRFDPPADRSVLTRGTDHLLLSARTASRLLTRDGAPLP